jgi:hypothetical protein
VEGDGDEIRAQLLDTRDFKVAAVQFMADALDAAGGQGGGV